MKLLFFIPVIIMTCYLSATIGYFGIPKSISDTYYLWKDKKYCRYLFTFVMLAVGLPVMIYWISMSKETLQCLPFLSVSGMCFVGAACAFKETLTKEVHYASAGVWAAFAVLYFVLTQSWISILLGAVIGLLGYMLNCNKNFTFWAELACVIMMIAGIYNL